MKLLYILLGVSTIVLIGSVIYLIFLNKQIKPLSENKTSQQAVQQLPGRLKEDELKKKYYGFVKDSKINMTFSGKVYEISPYSITLIDDYKNKLTIIDDYNNAIINIFPSPASSGADLQKLKLSDIKIGNSVEVSTSINNSTGKMSIDILIKLNSQKSNAPSI